MGDVFKLLAGRVYLLLAGVATSAMTARALGPDGRGQYALIIQAGTVITSLFGGLSIPVARRASMQDKSRSGLADATFLAAILGSTGSLGLLAYLLAARIPAPGLIYSLSVLLALFNVCWSATSLGAGRANDLIAQSATTATTTAIVTLMLVVWGHWGVAGALDAVLAGQAIGFAVLMPRFWSSAPFFWKGITLRTILEMAKEGLWASSSNVVGALNTRLDYWLIATFLPMREVGIYSIAVAGAGFLTVITGAVQNALYGRLGSAPRPQAIQLLKGSIAYFAGAMALAGIAAAALMGPVIRLLYGIQFLPAIPVARVLILQVIAQGITSLLMAYYFNHAGKASRVTFAGGLQMTAMLACAWILIPRLHLVGAATAMLVAQCVAAASMTYGIRTGAA